MKVKQRRYLAILLAMAMVISSVFTGYGNGVQVKAEGERAFKGFRFEAGVGNGNNPTDRATLNYKNENPVKSGTYVVTIVPNVTPTNARYLVRFGQQSPAISGSFGYNNTDKWYIQIFNNGPKGTYKATNSNDLTAPEQGKEIKISITYNLEAGTVQAKVNGVDVTFSETDQTNMAKVISDNLKDGGSVGFAGSYMGETVYDSIDIVDVELPEGISATPDWTKKDNWEVISTKGKEVFEELGDSAEEPTEEPSTVPFKGFRFEAGAGNTNNWSDRAILNYNSENAVKKGTYSAKVVSNLEAKDTRYCLRFGQQSTLVSGAFGYAHGDSMGWYVQVFNNGSKGIFTASNPKKGEGALPIPKKGEKITSVVDYDLENGTVSITVNDIPVTFTDKAKEDMTAAIKNYLSEGGSVGFSASEFEAVHDSIDILDVTLPEGISATPDWTKKENWAVISTKGHEVFKELDDSIVDPDPSTDPNPSTDPGPSTDPNPSENPKPSQTPDEGENLPTDPDWMQVSNWEVVDADSSAVDPAKVGIANLGQALYFGAGGQTGNSAKDRSVVWYKTDKKVNRGVFSADITPAGVFGLSLRFGVIDELRNATFGWNSSWGWHIQVFDNGNKGHVESDKEIPAPEIGKTVNLEVSMNLSAGTVTASVDGVEAFYDIQVPNLASSLGEGGSVGFGLSKGDGMTISNVEFPEELKINMDTWSDTKNWNITNRGEKFEASGIRSLAFFGDSNKNANVMYKLQDNVTKGTVKTDVIIDEIGKTSIAFGYKDKNNYSALSYDSEKKWYLENVTDGKATSKDLTEPSDLVMEEGKAVGVKLVFDESKDMVSVAINNKSLCGNQFAGEVLEGITAGKIGFIIGGISNTYINSYSYENDSWNIGSKVERPEKTKIIKSNKMEVTLDEEFPSIMQYVMDGKTFYGQSEKLKTIQINGVDIVPNVQSEFKYNQAIYTLTVKDEANKIDAEVTIKVSVENNILTYNVTNVKNNNDTKIVTIYIPNLSPISVRSTQENAAFAGATMTTNIAKKSDEYVDVNIDYIPDTKENKGYMYAFVSNSDLSAGIYSSSEANAGGKNWGRLLRNSYISQDENGESYVSIGLNSSPWYYQHESQDKTDKEMYTELQTAETSELNQDDMYFKVILTGNVNDDNKVDWQDGAVAYREIMHVPLGAEEIPDQVAQRITENFGSTAAHPFLKTADNLKRVALSMDGIGQRILIKGYASEGHDSAHPDYYDINKRAGGVKDLNVLTDEAKKYNAAIGVHINATEMYPEADAYGDVLEPGAYNWDWIDTANMIDTKADLNGGTRYDRLKKMKELVPDLNFVYVDVWYNDDWQAYHLAEQIQSLGWSIASEWAHAVEGNSLWSHWSTDLNYGGTDNKGINSDITRFISNHQRDVWMQADISNYQPLLGGTRVGSFEGWGNAGTNMNYDNYINIMFSENVPTKFIQHFEVSNWVNDEEGKEREITLKSADGAHTVVTKRNGEDDTSRIITLDGKTVLVDNTSKDRKYLIPWNWNEKNEQKLYHWNTKAEESTWELPEDWSEYTTVKMYKLTDNGRTEEKIVNVNNGRVTLSAEANTGYIVIPGSKESKQIRVEYGVDSHLVDPGFNNMGEKGWTTTGTGFEFDRKEQYNDPRVVFSNNSADAAVSQVLKDLEPGKQYTALVYVDNKDEKKKASLKVTIGDKVHEVYTYKTIGPNVVKSDSHHTIASGSHKDWKGRMNTMQVSFIAPEDGTDVVLSLTCEEGISTVYFDDVRVVESTSNYYPNSRNVFEQGFENNEKGLYPFVTSYGSLVTDNLTHLSERHDPYTQRGNANYGGNKNVINDVINGNWSLKVQQLARPGLVYQTIPQNLRFEPGVTYKVSFIYETGTAGYHTFVVGDGDYADNQQFSQTFAMKEGEKQKCEFEVTGSESGQTWIGLMLDTKGGSSTKVENATGKYNFVLDDLRVERLTDKLTIESIQQKSVRTVVGKKPNLPEKVTAVYSDGVTEEVDVKWDAIDPSQYEKENKFEVKGTVTIKETIEGKTEETTKEAICKVIVTEKEISTIEPVTVQIKAAEVPKLPEKVTITYEGGKTEEAEVTWTRIDPSQYGEGRMFMVRGRIEGMEEEIVCTITVKSTVQSIEPEVVTTTAKTAPNLPKRVTVTYTNGKKGEVDVTWGRIDEFKYQKDGTFEVKGSVKSDIVDNNGNEAICEVIVLPIIESIQPETVTTTAKITPNLPQKVTVVYTNEKTEDVKVKWDAIDPSEYETERTFDVTGSVAGTNIKAKCTVNVMAEPVNVDRTKLQQLVEQQYNKTEYTEDSWKVYEEKLNAAKSILIKEDATQAEIDTTAKELEAAIAGLVKIGTPTENPDPTQQPTNPPAPPVEVPTQDTGNSGTPAPAPTATPEATATPVPTEKPEATATPTPTEKPQEDLLNQIKVSSKRTVYVGGSKNTAAVAPKIPSGLTSVKEFSGDEDEVFISYRSSNTKVVTVSNRGKLTAKKAGSAVITVTAELADGQTKTFKQNVTVKKASLKFTKSASTITLGKKATFTVALYGYNKSDIVWTTTKKDKAAVAKNKGKVTVSITGKTAGKDTVVVTVKDSKGKSVTLKKAVTVK